MPSSQNAADTARKINYWLERLIPVTTPFGIAIGFILPGVFIHLRPSVIWLFAVITLAGALKLRTAELGAAMRKPSPILIFFVTAHVLMPVIAMFSSSVFFVNSDIVTGFVLLFAGPTAVSGFFWVLIFKGNKALGLALILLDTVLAPFVVPGTLSVLMGKIVSMDMTGIALSLVMMVVLPTIVGITVNEASRGKLPDVICPYLDPFAKILLIVVIAANASVVAPKIQFNDPLIWKTAAVCILLTFAGFVLIKTAVVLFRCERDKGASVIIAGGLRNNSAVMTIAVTFFPEAAVFPTLLSIIFQQSIMAIAGKLFVKTKSD